MTTKIDISDASKALCALETSRIEAGERIQAAMIELVAADAAIAAAIATRDAKLNALSQAIDFRDAIDARARDIIRIAQEDNGVPYAKVA